MKNKGFSLIEILIVVTILGVLSAIVLPRFTSSSDDAKKNAHITERGLIDTQSELYQTDIGSIPTAMTYNGWGGEATFKTYFPDTTLSGGATWKCNQNTNWVLDANGRIIMADIINGHHAAGDKHENTT